jgi:hypothetical protein
MSEKRQIRRIRGRLPVTFEAASGKGAGYTANYSPGGIQIVARLVYAPGTQLKGKMTLPDKVEVPFDAEVRWAKRVSVRGTVRDVSLQAQNTMGLKFLNPLGEAYFSFLQREWAREAAVGAGAATAAPAPAEIVPPLLRVKPGAKGRARLITDADGRVLSGALALQLIERAAEQALEGAAPGALHTCTVSVTLTLQPSSLPKGAEITAQAAVTSVDFDDGTLGFEVTILHGESRLGTASLSRVTV